MFKIKIRAKTSQRILKGCGRAFNTDCGISARGGQ